MGGSVIDQIVKTVYARYKNSTWPVILYSNGNLTCQGPGYGPWGTEKVHISSNVKNVWAAGTAKGPAILYQSENSMEAMLLFWNTGKEVAGGHVCDGHPMKVRLEPHRYGVVVYVELPNSLVRVEIDGWGHFKVERK